MFKKICLAVSMFFIFCFSSVLLGIESSTFELKEYKIKTDDTDSEKCE